MRISKDFQKRILTLEEKAKRQVNLLKSTFDSNGNNEIWKAVTFPSEIEEEGEISLFIYKNDSLIFWSNNSVLLPDHLPGKYHNKAFASHFKNGWHGFYSTPLGSYRFLGSYQVNEEFPFQNDFIKNKFSPWFDVPASVSIENSRGPHPVFAGDKSYLFSLSFETGDESEAHHTGVMFLLFSLGSMFLLYFIYKVYTRLLWFNSRGNLLVIAYSATIVFLRLMQVCFRFPSEIYHSELFGPAWYSSSQFLPSLGDYTLNAVLLMIMSTVFLKHSLIRSEQKLIKTHQTIVRNIICVILILTLFNAAGYLVEDLIINSSISLNLKNISGLTYESGYGLFIISAVLYSLWAISTTILGSISWSKEYGRWNIVFAVIVGSGYMLAGFLAGWNVNYPNFLFFLVYIALFWYSQRRSRTLISFQNILIFLCFFSVFATVLLNASYRKKETAELDLLAIKLSSRRNPVTEVLYEQVERRIYEDTLLNSWINLTANRLPQNEDTLADYLKSHYFKEYWNKYQVQATFCDPSKNLRIQPQGYLINCNQYFQRIIVNYGEATAMPNLFFLDYGLGNEFYLAFLPGNAARADSSSQRDIYIEFSLKNDYPDPGYPGLLMDKSKMELPDLSDYSYGLYQNGNLVRAVGINSYRTEVAQYQDFSSGKQFFSDNNMIHVLYRINKTDLLVISKKKETLLSLASPFPYLFILFALVVLVITGLSNLPHNLRLVPESLRSRLQLSLLGILVLTAIAAGLMQLDSIIGINAKKNVDHLREKSTSVVVEVQHKYGGATGLNEIEKSVLEDFLIKLSNVFFTDINVYNQKGRLVASSRPQIFSEGFLSERMNPEAYRKMAAEKNSIFIHNESIGSMQFNSAYLPFYNENDQLLGYVNLPYFARQDEAKKEISSFLVTFFNVYILLILIGVFIIILISNYITGPLAVLAKRMSQLRLGSVNEKIPWRHNDEIGQLVSEYNRMIDELAGSAEILAQSERESAWREMARQVAHEIKNPLTPMKLSVQHLEKAWSEKTPDWDTRFARVTKTLIEQIDALSLIASDFSNFAKMPAVVFMQVDLDEVIRFVLSFYQDTTPITFLYQSDISSPLIRADRSQLIRLFTNLINNAIQAIDVAENGTIKISIEKESQNILIRVSDNGYGIPADRLQRIFHPDFTTKTSGMGLGLAIAKGIVETMNGEITVISEEQKGTTFMIKFPIND